VEEKDKKAAETELKGFRGLKVWQKGKLLAVKVYEITGKGKFSTDFSLRDQVRRAAISIPSNIAEGDSLGTDKQSIRHFNIAKGSSAELMTQFEIDCDVGYISKDTLNEIQSECIAISGMLQRLISARSRVR
jgi:four helix bundle protein